MARAMALPAGTVTMLFTDIEGSTRLLEHLGERYADVLTEHHRIVRGAIAAHGGQELRTEGDAFFVVFTRAGDAVRAAVAAQRGLAAFAWPAGGDGASPDGAAHRRAAGRRATTTSGSTYTAPRASARRRTAGRW